MKQSKTRRSYVFRIPNIRWDITWLEDAEVETEIRRTDGEVISLPEAVRMFYSAAISGDSPENIGVNQEVLTRGIIGYAKSKGYRVELLPYIIRQTAIH